MDDEKLKDIDINDLYEARFDNFYSDVMARINEKKARNVKKI